MNGIQYRRHSVILFLVVWSLNAIGNVSETVAAPELNTILKVPGPNKLYALAPYHSAQEIEINDAEPIFYILIHGTYSSQQGGNDPEIFYWGEDEFTETVPKDFFGLGKNPEKAPIRFAFRWSGNLSDDARKKGGKKLAACIKELYAQFPEAWVICVGHSHGGNVMNVASQYLDDKRTIDFAIQLATPVLAYNSKKDTFDNGTGYYPNHAAIDTLMIFYSEHDFIQPGGASVSSYKRRYAPIAGIDLYNVRMRKLRAIDDLHIRMHDHVVGGVILELCHKIKMTYKGNKNLIADITPAARRTKFIDALKPEAKAALLKGFDMAELIDRPLVCIKPYKSEREGIVGTAKSYFQGKPTDSFWPDWTGKYSDEINASNEDSRIFKGIYGFSMTDRMTLEQRLSTAVDEIGKEGRRMIKKLF